MILLLQRLSLPRARSKSVPRSRPESAIRSSSDAAPSGPTVQRLATLEQRLDVLEARSSTLETQLQTGFAQILDRLDQRPAAARRTAEGPTGETPPPKAIKPAQIPELCQTSCSFWLTFAVFLKARALLSLGYHLASWPFPLWLVAVLAAVSSLWHRVSYLSSVADCPFAGGASRRRLRGKQSVAHASLDFH